MIDPAAALAAEAEVEGRDAEVVDEDGVVRSRSQRADPEICAVARLLLLLGGPPREPERAEPFRDRDLLLRIDDLAGRLVDELFERVGAARVEESAAAPVGVDVRDGAVLELRGVGLAPLGRSEEP